MKKLHTLIPLFTALAMTSPAFASTAPLNSTDAPTNTAVQPTDPLPKNAEECVTELLNQVIQNGSSQGLVRANASLTIEAEAMGNILRA